MSVCLSPLLELLDLAVLVALWWCKTRRGAILAVLVVFWGSGGKIAKHRQKSLRHSVSYWGCLTLRNLDARGPSQEVARRPERRPAGHSSAGLYGRGLPDRTGCPV